MTFFFAVTIFIIFLLFESGYFACSVLWGEVLWSARYHRQYNRKMTPLLYYSLVILEYCRYFQLKNKNWFLKNLPWGHKMAQNIKAPVSMIEDLYWILGIHLVKGENQLLQVVL